MTQSAEFSGMTVNERLFASGQIDEWDRAIASKNIHLATEMLVQLGMGADQAGVTVDAAISRL